MEHGGGLRGERKTRGELRGLPEGLERLLELGEELRERIKRENTLIIRNKGDWDGITAGERIEASSRTFRIPVEKVFA